MIDVEEYLNNLFKANKKRTLKAMQYFMNKFQHFEKEMKFIHIAGTNGKGSCTEIIANILEKQGYKVGKFLSPHLIKYNERISINGKEISDEEMSDIIEELQPLIEEYNHSQNTKVTVFELITTMALLYFYRNSVDFVVLETVLGGLDDCTNIITNPVVSVITSIGYDHTKILGDTLTEIAHQKAGIIKENSHTVIFEQEADINEVFINECKKKNNNLHIVNNSDISNYSFDEEFQHFNYKDLKNLSINLKGKMQIQNASICIEVINILNKLGYKVNEKNILEGLKTVIHKGRMEQLSNNPKIIYDGAHNDPAIRNLLDMVDIYYPKLKRVYIISILKRKDYRRMLKLLAKDENAIFVMTSGNDSDRYASKDELYDCMKEFVNSDRIYRKELDVALQDALNTDDDTVNFVIGSLYTYSTVVNKIKKFLI